MLPVFNGVRFLQDQLDSLLAQTHENWVLSISDDGSTDGSNAVLKAFQTRYPNKTTLVDGPKQGLTCNLFSLLRDLPADADFVAFCDQDDIWHTDRLTRAIASLGTPEIPSLYCSRTNLIDAGGRFLRTSPPRPRAPSFQNALVQNIASGNTMILNRAAAQLLQDHLEVAQSVPYPDLWTYQMISGAGGRVIHDREPSLEYRQHRDNVVGAATGLSGVLRRIKRVAAHGLSADMTHHLVALERSRTALTPDACVSLDALLACRGKHALSRLRGVWVAGLYRQSKRDTLGLWAAALLGRL